MTLAYDIAGLASCFRLLHDQYVSYEYMSPAASGMRFSLWNALPSCYTAMAKDGNRLLGTVSYIVDSAAGLPMDEIGAEKLGELRQNGRLLCEISSLAVDPLETDQSVLMRLFQFGFRLVFDHLKVTDYVISVNPRHVKFYEKMLLFEKMGEVSFYGKVNNAPAVLMHLDLTTSRDRYQYKYGRRCGGRNLFNFFCLSGAVEFTGVITAMLELRLKLLDAQSLLHFFRQNSRIFAEVRNLEIFTRQWSEYESQHLTGGIYGHKNRPI